MLSIIDSEDINTKEANYPYPVTHSHPPNIGGEQSKVTLVVIQIFISGFVIHTLETQKDATSVGIPHTLTMATGAPPDATSLALRSRESGGRAGWLSLGMSLWEAHQLMRGTVMICQPKKSSQ